MRRLLIQRVLPLIFCVLPLLAAALVAVATPTQAREFYLSKMSSMEKLILGLGGAIFVLQIMLCCGRHPGHVRHDRRAGGRPGQCPGDHSLVCAGLTDGNNHTTQYILDLRGRLLQETDALSNSTYEQLNGAGDLVREIDPLGHVTVNTYSPAEDLTQVTNADGSYTFTQYDSKFHEVTQTTNSLGEQTSSVYDQTTGL